jgi:hypothetical protein
VISDHKRFTDTRARRNGGTVGVAASGERARICAGGSAANQGRDVFTCIVRTPMSRSAYLVGLTIAIVLTGSPVHAQPADTLGVAERLLEQAAFVAAADAYESYAARHAGPEAAEAISPATRLRYLLADEPALIRLEQLQWERAAELEATRAARSAANEASGATLKLARIQVDAGKTGQARLLLERRMLATTRTAALAQRAAAYAALADVALAQQGAAAARAAFAQVLSVTQRAERYGSEWGTEAQAAAGAAHAYFADQQFRTVMAIAPPTYTGPNACSSLRRFAMQQVLPWISRAGHALEQAERAYAVMLGIVEEPPMQALGLGDPVAPRRSRSSNVDIAQPDRTSPLPFSTAWAVYASDRLGTLFDAVSIAMSRAPVPQSWCYSPMPPYVDQLDPATDPVAMQADEWFSVCAALWTRHRVGPGANCINWNDRHHKPKQDLGNYDVRMQTLQPLPSQLATTNWLH